MSKSYNKRLTLRLDRSYFLAVLLLVMHVGAAVCLLLVTLPISLGIIAATALAISLYHSVMRHALRLSRDAIIRIEEYEGRFVLHQQKDGLLCDCKLISRFIHPRLTILAFKCDESWFSIYLVILKGMVDTDRFRDLRRRLVDIEPS